MTAIRTTNIDGSQPHWLDRLGTISGLTYSATYDGGSTSAQFNFSQTVNFDHLALGFHRLVTIYAGTVPVWSGRIDQPQRGQPWQITCTGSSAELHDFAAFLGTGSGTGNIYDVSTVVSGAQSRGALFSLAGTEYPGAGVGGDGTITIDGVMTQAVTQGSNWWMNPARQIFMTQGLPTTVGLVITPGDTPGSRSGQGYANATYMTYINSSGTQKWGTNAAASAAEIGLWGEVETVTDVTELGPLTNAQVAALKAQIVAASSGTPPWTSPLTVGVGQIWSPGGGPVDPAVLPGYGPTLVQVQLVDPDTVTNGATAQFVVGGWSYDADSNTCQISPYQSARVGLLAALTRRSA